MCTVAWVVSTVAIIILVMVVKVVRLVPIVAVFAVSTVLATHIKVAPVTAFDVGTFVAVVA